MNKDKSKLTIAYTGEAVDDGTMDVSVLGPALMALGTLVNEANKIVNNDNSTIAVKVNADFQKGSFEIQLDVIRTLADQLQSLFTNHISVAQLLEYLGLGATVQSIVGGPSVIDIIKWVKNRKIDKAIKNDNKTATLVIQDESVTVNIDVLNIYMSIPVRESLDAMVAPTKRSGIDSFEVRKGQDDKSPLQVISKEESESFTFDESDFAQTEEVDIQRYTQWVTILTVNFEELKWRFKSGENKYYAKVDDEDFLKKIEGGLSFTKGDMLQIDLEDSTHIKLDGHIRHEYRVTKVLKIQKRARAIPLPFDEA